MVLFYIFVKKEGSNPFSSNGRVKIFSSESRKFFVKKQPHPTFGAATTSRLKVFLIAMKVLGAFESTEKVYL